jgi:hypothetical protein
MKSILKIGYIFQDRHPPKMVCHYVNLKKIASYFLDSVVTHINIRMFLTQ